MPQANQRIRRVRPATKITARVSALGPRITKRADTSRQIYQENEFASGAPATLQSAPLIPPYDPLTLLKIIEQSNMVKQCVAAYVTNVALCGFEIAPAVADQPMDPEEQEELQSFIDHANADESLMTLHAKVVADYEKLGYGYVEVIRDRAGRISIFRHARAATMRLMRKDETYIPVTYDIARGRRVSTVTEFRQFRRFVQIINGKTRYFKEFGDPRRLHYETGVYAGEGQVVPDSHLATEIVHFRQDSEDAYGVPRWINQLPSILGSREAEEVNLRYFEDNTVPPMILSVAGGRLTQESYRQLQAMLTEQSIGRERQNKIILIEAVPERESLDDKGSVQLKVDKLADVRQSDGLFEKYDSANQSKVRSSFRLPPVAVGLSQDVTFATANVSAFIAESQVYAPLRRQFDEVWNKMIVTGINGFRMKTCVLVSNVPAITNPQELIKSLTALNTMGALTPRMALESAVRILEFDLPMYPKKGEEGYAKWMDEPIIFVTKGTASQAGQAQKDAETKATEEDGDVQARKPETGSE
jgi:PBSX family phage portal protein